MLELTRSHMPRCLVCGSEPSAALGHLTADLSAAPSSQGILFTTPHSSAIAALLEAAAGCTCAIVAIDANDGITPETLSQCLALHVLGLHHVTFALDADDIAHLSPARYEALASRCRDIAEIMGFGAPAVIPVSTAKGDNVAGISAAAPWYDGPCLAAHVTIAIGNQAGGPRPMRAVIDGTGVTRLIHGPLGAGDKVAILPAGRVARIATIMRGATSVRTLAGGETAELTLDDGTDLAAGDVLAPPELRPEMADQVAAHLIWAADDALLPGRPYGFRALGQTAIASVSTLKYKINEATLEHVAARQLELGEIGFCNLSISHPVVFDPYEVGGETGQFELTDTVTGATVAAGLIRFGLRRAENVHWQALSIDKGARAAAKNQAACCLWFTGLSGSGKSTIANLLERKLHSTGRHTYILDGDNVRHGLNRDLGFADADRVENIRRVAEVAKLMVDAGLIVIVSFISPFRAERRMARDLFKNGEFVEVYIETPIEVCEARDPKGLYAKARKGLIRNFTGIDSDYESPEAPELRLDTTSAEPADLAEHLLKVLGGREVM